MPAPVAPWNRLHRVTRALLLISVANLAVGSLAPVLLLGTPPGDTTLGYTARLVRPQTWSRDSWKPMGSAFDYLAAPQPEPRVPVYTQVFFTDHIKFLYPPSALLVFQGLHSLGLTAGQQRQALNLISGLAFVVTVLTAWQIFEISLARHLGNEPGLLSSVDRAARFVACLILAATFFPAVLAVTLGQIQAWINALAVVLVWCWLKDRKGAAGALAGAMTLIKPQSLLLLLWGLLRRERRFSLAFAGTLAAGLLGSIAVYGLGNHFNYLSVLAYISRHGESYFSNQSVNGVLNRLLYNGSLLDFNANAYPPYHPFIYAATLISSAALVGLALFWRPRRAQPGGQADISVMLLTSVMASPLAWRHHYGALLALYAWLAAWLWSRDRLDWRVWAALAVSYALASNHLAFVNQLAFATYQAWYLPMNLVLSYLFAGALLALGLLHAVRQGWLCPATA